ncbi:MAG: phosphoribosylanthranilate isomerase [Lachnospiraceae bacterium]|nr:phosphoribosylanthranilate isomerase [Lachnospiraceae bacterium]
MKIKICGLKRKEDVDYVNQAVPDWVGFVFAGTKRQIDYETAKMLKQHLHPQIMVAGVFVNADISFIIRLVAAGILDMIQLHGDEDQAYILELRSHLSECGKENVTVIKAVRVRMEEEIKEADELPVDYLLLDAFDEESYGGSGKIFDHKLIPQLKKPFILAGGITEKNVICILEGLKEEGKLPVCVDVSSSVESNGYKDKEKIEKVIGKVRGWNYM